MKTFSLRRAPLTMERSLTSTDSQPESRTNPCVVKCNMEYVGIVEVRRQIQCNLFDHILCNEESSLVHQINAFKFANPMQLLNLNPTKYPLCMMTLYGIYFAPATLFLLYSFPSFRIERRNRSSIIPSLGHHSPSLLTVALASDE